jgi:hypothetical protein
MSPNIRGFDGFVVQGEQEDSLPRAFRKPYCSMWPLGSCLSATL